MITVIERPFKIDFLQNKPSYTLLGEPYDVYGRKGYAIYTFNSFPEGVLTVTSPFFVKKFPIVDYRTSNNTMIVDDNDNNINIIVDDYDINKYYDVIRIESNRYQFIDKNYNIYAQRYYPVNLANINITHDSIPTSITLYSSEPPIRRKERNNYKVYVQFDKTSVINTGLIPEMGSITCDKTIPLLLSPVNEKVKLNIGNLIAFNKIDIPLYNESYGSYSLENNIIFIRELFGEFYNGVYHNIRRNGESIMLLNCKTTETGSAYNLPYWNQINNTPVSSKTDFDCYGVDNDIDVRTFKELEQYIYIWSATEKTVNVIVHLLHSDGKTDYITLAPLKVSGIMRIPTRLKNLVTSQRTENVIAYKIEVSGENGTFTRRYNIIQKPYNATSMLLENDAHVLESFFVENISLKKNITGKEYILNGQHTVDIEDSVTIYRAKSGFKSVNDIRLFEQAVSNKFNFVISNDGTLLHRIQIQPDSYKITDSEDDLHEFEFDYILSETIKRNSEPFSIDNPINITDTLIL